MLVEPAEAMYSMDGGELSEIANMNPQSQWPEHLMQSDLMMIFLNRIDWNLPGTMIEQGPGTIREFLAETPA